MNFVFNDNVRILCLSCNVKKLVRFKQKGQQQASFLAFYKCCQGCLLRGPRYISTSFLLVCALRCTQLQGTRKVYSQAEKFIRLIRIKQKINRIAYLYSKCTDCRIKYMNIHKRPSCYITYGTELELHLQINKTKTNRNRMGRGVPHSITVLFFVPKIINVARMKRTKHSKINI